jgi:uncharacterized protein
MMTAGNILISGGTGLVGKALCRELIKRGYTVTVLSRTKGIEQDGIRFASWNIEEGWIDPACISEADAVIHLAGASIAEKRWTPSRKQEIVDSRVNSGRLLSKAIRETPNHIQTFITASALGWYGRDPQPIPTGFAFNETMEAASDYLGSTCRQWEESTQSLGTQLRWAAVRIGIVLSQEGGALQEFRKPLQLGVAGIIGKGKQVISWIHIKDLCGIFIHLLQHQNLHGPFNAVAPNPVTNRDLTLKLAEIMRGKYFLPLHVPAFALKWILGEMSEEILKSATLSAKKIEDAGYIFQHPQIDSALRDLSS